MRARQRLSAPCRNRTFVSRQGLGLGLVVGVATEGFSVATDFLKFSVSTDFSKSSIATGNVLPRVVTEFPCSDRA